MVEKEGGSREVGGGSCGVVTMSSTAVHCPVVVGVGLSRQLMKGVEDWWRSG